MGVLRPAMMYVRSSAPNSPKQFAILVEILSPEDRVVRLQPKIQEYLAHGVEWVWVVDPDERRALS